MACVFGSALLGLFLRAMLPEHHLSSESKDVVKLAMGLIATMAALVLCAVAVSGSIFLILEMHRPFDGLMKVSSAPMHYALSQLGQ